MRTELTTDKMRDSLTEFHFEGIFKILSFNGINLSQFSDVQYNAASVVPSEHTQWCDEITYVYSGSGSVLHNGKKSQISGGQIHICHKGDVHQIFNENGETLRFYCIGYQLYPENPLYQLAQRVKAEIENGKSPIINDVWGLRAAFEHSLFSLYDGEDKQLSEHITVSGLNYILSVILKGYLKEYSPKPKNRLSKENLLFQIMGYLKSNLHDKDALKNISSEFGYSYSHISHLFSNVAGKNLKDYFTSLRMETANSLLRENKSVTQVSELLGYSSIHTFSRAYKAYFLTPPSQYK